MVNSCGKRYSALLPCTLLGASACSRRNSKLVCRARSVGRTSGSNKIAAFEGPLQRFLRLSDEVRILQDELGVITSSFANESLASGASSSTSAGIGEKTEGPSATPGVWGALLQGTQTLQAQLAALAPILSTRELTASGTAGLSEDWFDSALAKLKGLAEEGVALRHASPTVDKHPPDALPPSREAMQHLDMRLAALEAQLLAPVRWSHPSINRLPRHLEQGASPPIPAAAAWWAGWRRWRPQWRGSRPRPQAIADLTDNARSAAAALRQLQAAPANASAAAAGHGFIVAGERVVHAMQALERWDAWAPALPVLVTRLATLERVHREAALFTQRLALSEAALRSRRGADACWGGNTERCM